MLFEDNPEVEKAKNTALNQLSVRPRTRKELVDRLQKSNYDETVITRVLQDLENVGLINDRDFAVLWVRSRHNSKGLGKTVLRQELRRKGVSDEYIEEALELITDESQYERGRILAEKKARNTAGLSMEKRVTRISGMLMRKGYSAGEAFRLAKEALQEETLDTPTEYM